MVNIIKQEIEIEEALKNKIEFICNVCNTTPTIYEEIENMIIIKENLMTLNYKMINFNKSNTNSGRSLIRKLLFKNS